MTFVTLAAEGEALMRMVQGMGVLHPEHITVPAEAPAAEMLTHRLNMQGQVLHDLKSREIPRAGAPAHGGVPQFDEIEGWLSELKSIEEKIASAGREISHAERLGDFDPADVRRLAAEGISVQLWSVREGELAALAIPGGSVVRQVSAGRQTVFATVSMGSGIEIPGADPVELPKDSLARLREAQASLSKRRDELLGRLGGAASRMAELERQHTGSVREHAFQVALARAFRDETVMAFEGWVPAGSIPDIGRAASAFRAPVVMHARDPLADEEPPVLTKNGWLARNFEPLLHLFGIPGYRGMDPAIYFAPFMMLFFGICLGDLGYGAAMIVAAYIMKRALGGRFAQVGPVANMTMLFGVATAVWGGLTGSVFGAWPGGESTVLIDVSPGRGDPMILFRISIGLAVVHLSIAFLLAAAAAHTFGERVLKLGSLAILIGGILMVLKYTVWSWVFGAGVAAVLLFSSDSKNLFRRIGAGLWGLYNHIGLLGDVMSYSRLFGLGIATGAIASVVNMMAGQVRAAVPGLGVALAVLVLVAGHMFNMAMGLISSLVHPARLHAVEALPKFVTLTGEPYRPLAGETGP
ncbi:MAG: hypothetical protein JXA24_01140 [Proteobacteria bacterium]|nr:hypothetical protein [Pseudomonadota bacterium]